MAETREGSAAVEEEVPLSQRVKKQLRKGNEALEPRGVKITHPHH